MNKQRVARIARLVNLRQQQRQMREADHAEAARALERATALRARVAEQMQELDRQHDEFVGEEIDPLDLALLGEVRTHARGRLVEASKHVTDASDRAEARRAELLDAHRAHRSLEMFHDRLRAGYVREVARSEQREIDELALRAADDRRRL